MSYVAERRGGGPQYLSGGFDSLRNYIKIAPTPEPLTTQKPRRSGLSHVYLKILFLRFTRILLDDHRLGDDHRNSLQTRKIGVSKFIFRLFHVCHTQIYTFILKYAIPRKQYTAHSPIKRRSTHYKTASSSLKRLRCWSQWHLPIPVYKCPSKNHRPTLLTRGSKSPIPPYNPNSTSGAGPGKRYLSEATV